MPVPRRPRLAGSVAALEVETLERLEILRACVKETSMSSWGSICCEKGWTRRGGLGGDHGRGQEWLLWSPTSMIQTIGRAARNDRGRCIMYADKMTPEMQQAIDETEQRRSIQMAHNEARDHPDHHPQRNPQRHRSRTRPQPRSPQESHPLRQRQACGSRGLLGSPPFRHAGCSGRHEI